MPKKPVKKVPVYKNTFLAVLKLYNSSIRELGRLQEARELDICTEKNLRIQLNDEPCGLRPQYLYAIAEYYNIDPRVLSGQHFPKRLHKLDVNYQAKLLKDFPFKDYPYVREKMDERTLRTDEELIGQILPTFAISYSQYVEKDEAAKYNFRHELFEAILGIITKHFASDAYGDTQMLNSYYPILQMESAWEDYCLLQYADTDAREYYTQHLPKGYTKTQIQKMSASELVDIHLSLLSEEANRNHKWDELDELMKIE